MARGASGLFRKLALRGGLEDRPHYVIGIFVLVFLLVALKPASDKVRRRRQKALARARGEPEKKADASFKKKSGQGSVPRRAGAHRSR
mmetsp:Transcript_84509/g.149595  ORF Transcript_84509/g.149595 Transcript_84509/m.149595 type:complete len:88 (+) Transcript_84509:66-329(+)